MRDAIDASHTCRNSPQDNSICVLKRRLVQLPNKTHQADKTVAIFKAAFSGAQKRSSHDAEDVGRCSALELTENVPIRLPQDLGNSSETKSLWGEREDQPSAFLDGDAIFRDFETPPLERPQQIGDRSSIEVSYAKAR